MINSILNKIKNRINYYRCLLIVKKYAKSTIESFDENWFKGKRVAIIGGADSVLKDKLGEYIDGFDVVVRVNKGVEVIEKQYEYVGKRTDFLFHALFDEKNDKGSSPITIDLWNKHHVGKIINVHNVYCSIYGLFNFVKFLKISKYKLIISQLTPDLYYNTMGLVKPANGTTTGFAAIVSVFLSKPKELYITGITFFKTPHNDAYREFDSGDLKKLLDKSVGHDVEIEFEHVKELYLKHKNIIIPDDTLFKIFNNN